MTKSSSRKSSYFMVLIICNFTVISFIIFLQINLWCKTSNEINYPVHDIFFPTNVFFPDNSTQAKNVECPGFIIIGTQKSGTTSLHHYLSQHPLLVESERFEPHFFDFNFDRFLDTKNHTILVDKARKAYLNEWNMLKLLSNTSFVAYEKSPTYMLYSQRVAERAKAVCPSVKSIAMLRNPIDRAFSHYTMDKNGKRIDKHKNFRWCIERELKLMRKIGLVQNWDIVNFTEFSGSAAEDDAWRRYIREGQYSTCNYMIGRGLYAIQLRYWFDAFPAKDRVLVMKTEDMKMHNGTVAHFNRIISFLDLPKHDLRYQSPQKIGNYKKYMRDKTRKMLEDIYAPYNNQLKVLLGDEWDNAWGNSL